MRVAKLREKQSAPRQYGLLARYYDQFFTFHHDWYRGARQKVLGKILLQVRSACDLACGTGTTAIELARLGIKVFAVDLSPVMCRLARQKAKRVRTRLRVLQGDMRTFRLPEPVDLITSEFDAVNHIPRKADLGRVAKAAARALRPGGYFYFDVNNRMAFQKIWPGTWWLERPGIVLIMRGGYDHRHDRGWTKAEWFVRRGNLWRRSHDLIKQVSWSAREIHESLRGAGFVRIWAWDAKPFFQGDPRIQRGCRTFYLAQKSHR